MKTSVTNKLKKAFAFGMVASLPLFTACEKDNGNPSEPQPKIVKLVFDKNGHHIELDTIRYYLTQGADSIYMIANPYDMFAAQSSIHNATQFLQQRCDISPKVRGHNEIGVNSATAFEDREALKNMGFDVVIVNTK